jgi:topoisomerase-4 subunit A
MVEVMGWKAIGARLTEYSKSVEMEWERRQEGDQLQGDLFG